MEARREIEWAIRRWRGEGVDLIAREAGETARVVRRAIAWIAPLSTPQAHTSPAEADLWVQLRQMGHAAEVIAGYFGVTSAPVRHHTSASGPFPRWPEATVARWVEQRRARVSVDQIARSERVPIAAVRAATTPFGPFRLPRRDPLLMCLEDIRSLVGVSSPTVARWRDIGLLPGPDHVRGGRPLWRHETVSIWLEQCGHETCPHCGARPRSLSRHIGHTHR